MSESINIHKQYWGSVRRRIGSSFKSHKKLWLSTISILGFLSLAFSIFPEIRDVATSRVYSFFAVDSPALSIEHISVDGMSETQGLVACPGGYYFPLESELGKYQDYVKFDPHHSVRLSLMKNRFEDDDVLIRKIYLEIMEITSFDDFLRLIKDNGCGAPGIERIFAVDNLELKKIETRPFPVVIEAHIDKANSQVFDFITLTNSSPTDYLLVRIPSLKEKIIKFRLKVSYDAGDSTNVIVTEPMYVGDSMQVDDMQLVPTKEYLRRLETKYYEH